MEKYFVNYNQSLALKELGFDMPCLAFYWNTGKFYTCAEYSHRIESHKQNQLGDYNYDSTSAPLKSQVFEWARKEHKIHCSYGTTSDSREEVNGYCISNFIDGNRNYLHINWEVGTYDEAESVCVDKLIEIIKTK
jgi:hypothetical protein